MSPSVANLSPRIEVNYSPGDKAQTVNRTFTSWIDVSRWATSMHEGQVIVDDNVAAKARELTANTTTELDKIRAIGNYVQNLQYISIDIGVGHGNGISPRSSSLVLSRGYGDCKDKANLMRAMLKALKHRSISGLDLLGRSRLCPRAVAKPRQFNHCIIAVKVSDETHAPDGHRSREAGAAADLRCDRPITPVGDLPDQLQGSLALIAAGDSGGLSAYAADDARSRHARADRRGLDRGAWRGQRQDQRAGQRSDVDGLSPRAA